MHVPQLLGVSYRFSWIRIRLGRVRFASNLAGLAGRLRDIDPTVGAFSIAGMILWLPRWFRHGGRLTPEEAADEIANLALGGLLRTSAASPRKSRARAS
jgi:hypothetical protein